MLSLSSLLNPAPPGPPLINRFPPSPASSSPTTSLADDSSSLADRTLAVAAMPPKQKVPKDAAVFNTRSRPKGVVNYYPYERLDEASLRLVRKFQVFPLGKIQEYCRHIPYNSSKKDFYVKTSRESFEVFQYVFKVEDVEYVVMWDYNVGLVRMTPFFKCCKYPKTTPAKMLNANPGLKDITHSITGGSIMAQGYWMPYQCAKAVCATFCQRIAGALIPIFGPDFPSLCTPADTPEYSRMVIDPAIVAQATREAEHFRRIYNNGRPTSTPSSSAAGMSANLRRDRDRDRRVLLRDPYEEGRLHQLQQQHQPQPHPHPPPHHYQPHQHYHHQAPRQPHRLRKAFMEHPCDSPYTGPGPDTEGEMSPTTPDRSSERYIYSPAPSGAPASAGVPATAPSFRTHRGWTPANMLPHYEAPGPSPWLSAVPRLPSTSAAAGSGSSSGSGITTTGPPHSHPHTHPHPPPQPIHPPHLPRIYAPQGPGAGATMMAKLPAMTTVRTAYPSPQKHSWRPAAPVPDPGPGSKRSADHIVESGQEREHEQAYDAGQSRATTRSTSTAAASPSSTVTTAAAVEQRLLLQRHPSHRGGGGAADKNAALLLMNLSVRDSVGCGGGGATLSRGGGGVRPTNSGESGASSPNEDTGTAVSSITSSPRDCAGDGSSRRAKRIRSNSM